MAEIIRVLLTEGKVIREPVPQRYAMLGGRGFTSKIVFDEVDPKCNPLSIGNKLVIAPGLLAGTRAPNAGRLSVGAKSPLTGTIKESNAGGTVARKLARLGIKAVILEGNTASRVWYVLKIDKEGAELVPSSDLVGLGNFETMALMREKYGTGIGVMSIGQAGEMRLNAASIAVSDPDGFPNRHCGRGGLGAVMGSKGVKAIVVDDRGAKERLLEPVDEEGFNEAAKSWAKQLVVSKRGLTRLGTPALVGAINNVGGLPTRNFSQGVFEGAEKIDGPALVELIESRGGRTGHACSPGCVIRCCNEYRDEKGEYLLSSLEYETLGLMGANLGIDSLDVIANLNRKCNDYGLDTMEIGVAMGVAMEAGVIKFGDGTAAKWMVDEVAKGTVLGRVVGQGALATGKVFGVGRIPAVKGQACSAYDPRALKGTAVTYATCPMGADHTAGNCLPGRGGVDPNSAEGQIKVSQDIQIMSAVLDVLGICIFVGPMPDSMEALTELMSRATGETYGLEDVLEIGKRAIRTEIRYNRAAGFTREDDRLPEFFKKERLSPRDLIFDIADSDLDEALNI